VRGTTEWRAGVRSLLSDVERFTAVAGTRPLRPYQVEAARAVVESVRAGRGDVISVMMARQMGKTSCRPRSNSTCSTSSRVRGDRS
jgi:superfamily II DNA or RNA helicase